MNARRMLLAALLVGAAAGPARAHEGPPFPVVVDRRVGPYTLSVWTDPDVGTGTFFVLFDPPAWRSDADPRVAVEVRPATGRLAPARYVAAPQADHTWRVEVPFDREERWDVRVSVTGSRGDGETAFPVQVTPPGYGRWDLLIYFTPFALLGALWIAVALKRRRLSRRS